VLIGSYLYHKNGIYLEKSESKIATTQMDFHKAILLYSVFGLVNANTCPEMFIRQGMLYTTWTDSCTISLAGDLKAITFPDCTKVTGRWYGLVSWNVSSCSGILYSPIEKCDDCVLCLHNEIITKCRSFWLPFSVGIILACVMVAIVLGAYYRYKTRVWHCLFYRYRAFKYFNQQKKDERNLESLKRLTRGMSQQVNTVETALT